MNTRLILPALLGCSFYYAAMAQEFSGAEKALERIAKETAEAEAGKRQDDPAAAWLARVEEFAKSAAALPPKDAATRWLALVDEWRGLPAARTNRLGESASLALMKTLPPPPAWDALDEAVSARPREGNDAPFHLGLKMLTSSLRGDFPKVEATNGELKIAGTKARRGQFPTYPLKKIDEWIAEHRADPKAAVVRFEEGLALYERGNRSGRMHVPDLVTLAGAAKAEPLLKRALLAGKGGLQVQTGDATRALAVKTAHNLAARLKVPQWELIQGIASADIALYEALNKKFPRKGGDEDAHERNHAEAYYLLGLVQTRRTAEAVKLASVRADRDGDDAEVGETVMSLVRGGSVQPVRTFLRELLAKNPALPFWQDFISLSAKASESADALAFLRETAAREGLSVAARNAVREHLWSALLAADETEEGVKILRETLDARLAAAQGNRAKTGRGSYSETPGNFALKLIEVGRLLEKPDLVETGLKATHTANKADTNVEFLNNPIDAAKLLSGMNRGAEAEAVLVETWVDIIKIKGRTDEPRHGDEFNILSALAEVYHRAGRHDDVLALFEKATGWGAVDLANLSDSGLENSSSPPYIAASALAAKGRKDEARKILLELLTDRPGDDPAYELLLQIGGEDPSAFFDTLLTRDRFEERPLIWKAKLQLDAGRLDDAEKTVRAAIAIDPSDGEQGKGTRMRAYAVLGDILEKKGDDAQAKIMRGAVAAIRLSEKADDWWRAGLLTRAVKMYEEALGHFADAYCIQSRLSVRYAELGNFAKAEEHYLRAFELMPDSFGRIESHCFGCEQAFDGERAQGIAEKVFMRLAEKTPAKPQVFYLLGYLREEQGRHAEAAEYFRKAVSLDPDYYNAWMKLAALSEKIALPLVDREAAALNQVRLDPLMRHSSSSSISEVADFRQLWRIFDDAAKLAPVRATELFPLAAAKAELEHLKKTLSENSETIAYRFPYLRRDHEDEAQPPGAMLVKHDLISAVTAFLEGFVQGEDSN